MGIVELVMDPDIDRQRAHAAQTQVSRR